MAVETRIRRIAGVSRRRTLGLCLMTLPTLIRAPPVPTTTATVTAAGHDDGRDSIRMADHYHLRHPAASSTSVTNNNNDDDGPPSLLTSMLSFFFPEGSSASSVVVLSDEKREQFGIDERGQLTIRRRRHSDDSQSDGSLESSTLGAAHGNGSGEHVVASIELASGLEEEKDHKSERKLQSSADNGKWYANWYKERCVQSCKPTPENRHCDGQAKWDAHLFDTPEHCCVINLQWMTVEECTAPMNDESYGSTLTSSGSNNSGSVNDKEEEGDVYNTAYDYLLGGGSSSMEETSGSSPLSSSPTSETETSTSTPTTPSPLDNCPPEYTHHTYYFPLDIISLHISSTKAHVYECIDDAKSRYCNLFPPDWKRDNAGGVVSHTNDKGSGVLGWRLVGDCDGEITLYENGDGYDGGYGTDGYGNDGDGYGNGGEDGVGSNGSGTESELGSGMESSEVLNEPVAAPSSSSAAAGSNNVGRPSSYHLFPNDVKPSGGRPLKPGAATGGSSPTFGSLELTNPTTPTSPTSNGGDSGNGELSLITGPDGQVVLGPADTQGQEDMDSSSTETQGQEEEGFIKPVNNFKPVAKPKPVVFQGLEQQAGGDDPEDGDGAGTSSALSGSNSSGSGSNVQDGTVDNNNGRPIVDRPDSRPLKPYKPKPDISVQAAPKPFQNSGISSTSPGIDGNANNNGNVASNNNDGDEYSDFLLIKDETTGQSCWRSGKLCDNDAAVFACCTACINGICI